MINSEAENKGYYIDCIKEAAKFLNGFTDDKLWIAFKYPVHDVVAINISTMEAYCNSIADVNMNGVIALEKLDVIRLSIIKFVLELRKDVFEFLTADSLHIYNGNDDIKDKTKEPFSNPHKIYKVEELYEECDKIDKDVTSFFKDVLNPILNNKALMGHLIQYKWFNGIDDDLVHSSIQITPIHICFYLDGDPDCEEEVSQDAFSELTEKYPYIFSSVLAYQDGYRNSNKFPCYGVLTFSSEVTKRLSMLFEEYDLWGQINIQIDYIIQ